MRGWRSASSEACRSRLRASMGCVKTRDLPMLIKRGLQKSDDAVVEDPADDEAQGQVNSGVDDAPAQLVEVLHRGSCRAVRRDRVTAFRAFSMASCGSSMDGSPARVPWELGSGSAAPGSTGAPSETIASVASDSLAACARAVRLLGRAAATCLAGGGWHDARKGLFGSRVGDWRNCRRGSGITRSSELGAEIGC